MPLTHDDLCRIADRASLPAPGREDDPVVRDLERMLELVGELPEMPAGEDRDGAALPSDAAQEEVPGKPSGGKHTCLPRDVVLANAPAVRGDLVVVPAVLRVAGAREMEAGSNKTRIRRTRRS